MTAPVDVLAVRWVAELALSPNGMHEIRAGAVNARERPLVGYAATYADASEIAEAHNTRAAVAELAKAGKRVTDAFRGLGTSNGVIATLEARRECEQAMVALDAALAKLGGGA